VSFAAITLCVASQRVFIVYFVIEPVRKLLDTPSNYCTASLPSLGFRISFCFLVLLDILSIRFLGGQIVLEPMSN
jgi:hypothetical protein